MLRCDCEGASEQPHQCQLVEVGKAMPCNVPAALWMKPVEDRTAAKGARQEMPHDSSESTAGASIWLLPAAKDFDLLRTIITELSTRFGTPGFEPHLTLLGDLPARWGAYVSLLD